MKAEKSWNHDAYFDYVDRWMTEDDTQALAEIKKQLGADMSGGRQRQTGILLWMKCGQNTAEL